MVFDSSGNLYINDYAGEQIDEVAGAASTLSTPSTPTISNLPSTATVGGSFMATVTTTSNGVTSVVSNSSTVCTVGTNGLTVSYVGAGTCSLTAHVAADATYAAAAGTPQTFSVAGTDAAPVVTTQPVSQSYTSGRVLTFTAAASGTPAPTVQWQLSLNGGSTWTTLSADTSDSLTTGTLTSFENGWEVRAVFTNSVGSATSNAATMTDAAPVVTTQPVSQSYTSGQVLTFIAAASGTPAPTVQWQLSLNGGSTWTTLSADTSDSLTTGTLTSFENGWEVRAVFTNSVGSATSNAATMTDA